MLDEVGVFADEVLRHDFYHGFGGSLPSVDATFADSDRAVFGVYLDEQPSAPKKGLYLFDLGLFHFVYPVIEC